MLDLLVATDLVRRQMKMDAPKVPRTERREAVRPRRSAVRATSAAALRGLADRLEPSPTT